MPLKPSLSEDDNDVFKPDEYFANGTPPKNLLAIDIPCLDYMIGHGLTLDTWCSIIFIYTDGKSQTNELYTLRSILKSNLLLYAKWWFGPLQELFPDYFDEQRVTDFNNKCQETLREKYNAMIPFNTITKIIVDTYSCAEPGGGPEHYVTFYSTQYPQGISSRALINKDKDNKTYQMGFLPIKDLVTFYPQHLSLDALACGHKYMDEKSHEQYVTKPIKSLVTNLKRVSRVANLSQERGNKDESLAPYKTSKHCLQLIYEDGHQTQLPMLDIEFLVMHFGKYLDAKLLQDPTVKYYQDTLAKSSPQKAEEEKITSSLAKLSVWSQQNPASNENQGPRTPTLI